MEKSIVSMEKKVCAVCDKQYDTNSLLLQTREMNKPKLERTTVTGMGVCPGCTKPDYVTLVGIDVSRSTNDSVWKTGRLCYIKKDVAKQIFNKPIKDYTFIDDEGLNKLEAMLQSEEE